MLKFLIVLLLSTIVLTANAQTINVSTKHNITEWHVDNNHVAHDSDVEWQLDTTNFKVFIDNEGLLDTIYVDNVLKVSRDYAPLTMIKFMGTDAITNITALIYDSGDIVIIDTGVYFTKYYCTSAAMREALMLIESN